MRSTSKVLIGDKILPVVKLQKGNRINIPKSIIQKVSANYFAVEIIDGKIVLKPVKKLEE